LKGRPVRATPKPKTEYKIADEGVSLAWLISLVDLGTQTSEYQGQTKNQRKLRFTWELCGSQVGPDDPRPVTISQNFTWSFHDKAKLRSVVKSWTGKEPTDSFDLESLYQVPCQLNIIHAKVGEKTYANISTIMPLPKGTKVDQRVNETFTFDLDEQRCNALMFLQLPEYLRTMILKSPEGHAKFAADATGTPDIDADVPF